MKTIEQFKEEFDDKFDLYTLERCRIGDGEEISLSANYDVKEYIFQELLPQVLSEIIPDEIEKPYDYLDMGENTCIKMLKQKAKEMGINLPE